MLLQFPHLTLPQVATWLNLVDDLGPLPPVIAKAMSTSSIAIETDVLNLTTVAEGLHSRIFPARKRMSQDEAARLRKLVRDAVKDESDEHKATIRDATGHLTELSYKQRLLGLAEEASRAAPNIVGDAGKWASIVRDCRNDYAHRSAGFLDRKSIDKYLGVILSLRWILTVVLLLQTGIAPELLAKRLDQDQAYQFFLVQTRELLPEAYPKVDK